MRQVGERGEDGGEDKGRLSQGAFPLSFIRVDFVYICDSQGGRAVTPCHACEDP